MAPSLTDERLDALYVGEGFGGDNTMRAKVIRELIDEIRKLRRDRAPSTTDAHGDAADAQPAD